MSLSVEERLTALEQRNQRVEADKAWETSTARKLAIAAITYIIACAFLASIGATNWALGAGMPVIGYLLSTITLPMLKQRWISARINKEK